MNNLTPIVIEGSGNQERVYDIYSRLLKERIIFIGDVIDEDMSNTVVAQLLFLSNQNDEDITLYINSPGGHVSDGLAIYDTMQFIKPDIRTMCIGKAMSMAQILLISGTPGKRCALPNSSILMHQPMGGAWGQTTDIDIYTKEMLKIREQLYKIISNHTNKSVKQIRKDAERDLYMTPEEALKYGMIDKIINKQQQI